MHPSVKSCERQLSESKQSKEYRGQHGKDCYKGKDQRNPQNTSKAMLGSRINEHRDKRFAWSKYKDQKQDPGCEIYRFLLRMCMLMTPFIVKFLRVNNA